MAPIHPPPPGPDSSPPLFRIRRGQPPTAPFHAPPWPAPHRCPQSCTAASGGAGLPTAGHPQLRPFPTWRAGRWTWPNTSRQFSFQASGKGEESLSLELLTSSRPSPALPFGPLLWEVSLTPRPAWRPVYPRTAACTRHHGRSHNCQRLFGGVYDVARSHLPCLARPAVQRGQRADWDHAPCPSLQPGQCWAVPTQTWTQAGHLRGFSDPGTHASVAGKHRRTNSSSF